MYVEVVFPLPFRKAFTYSVPKDLSAQVKVGVRVIAPFGRRTITGFVTNKTKITNLKEEIKSIVDALDEKPIVDKNGLKFYKWLADYYLCSFGEALKLAMPYGSEVESKRKIIPDQKACAHLLSKEKNKSSTKGTILKVLSEKKEISLSRLQKLVKKKNIYSSLRTLQQQGIITLLDFLNSPKVKAKTVNYVKLNKKIGEIYSVFPELERRSPKQLKLLLELINAKGAGLPVAELLHKTSSSKSSIDSLAAKGFVKIYQQEIDRRYVEQYREEHRKLNLSKRQNKVFEEVLNEIKIEKFRTFLLHGVTGSGKTQVYIELTKKVIEQDKTALILVPEISLTPQITSRFYNVFGDEVTVLHSRMSPGERYDSWRRIFKRKSSVVIGARSALFAPLKNLGLIVVDEEHDASYKQGDMIPKYNARDSAIVLARFQNCPVVLGSATPSIESMYNAQSGKYKLLEIPDRIDEAKLPLITLVDVNKERKKKKMENIFSKTLLNKIEERLKRNEGVIILQNRRGFSTQIYCTDCGEVEICDNCSVPMVYHINKNNIQCHYCGLIKTVPNACTNCGSLQLKYFGTGTERVEDELEFYFPNVKMSRIDSDSISKKSSLSKILLSFGNAEVDVLVGTQMVSKGLDFSRVTLVGVISAETTLWLPDFRADERTFQLLTQVSGRAGRSKNPGEVIIQTQNEKHFALQMVLNKNYKGFYQKEIADREKMEFPPFARIALIETKEQSNEKAKGAILGFYNELKKFKNWMKISSPSPAIISKLKGQYRYQILIKSSKETDAGGKVMRKAILDSFVEFNRKSRYKDVRLFFDVDPQSLI
ncbi:MAG: primosomal protein N' [Ignavibacteria bacterium]|nr:primosomal protein N' [Ignavibacteria bacterium]MBT8382841.1 primosomal protein N' [Ignavibacteria bacterium]MBT8393073.1 primosomal protein N' [Ignavibacteria bacterium]NNJ53584.1 primosomal protein N' [Ignavibacteriaceae bacterium]NNL20191.1 primosomal protein N' [Ignavibacteriaceae bacterium]